MDQFEKPYKVKIRRITTEEAEVYVLAPYLDKAIELASKEFIPNSKFQKTGVEEVVVKSERITEEEMGASKDPYTIWERTGDDK